MPRLLTEGEGVGGHPVAVNAHHHLVFAVGTAPQVEEIVPVDGDGLESTSVHLHVGGARRRARFQAQHQVHFAGQRVETTTKVWMVIS